MALYWKEEKVALDIVDDPYRRPFEGDDSYTVLRVTRADLLDYDSYLKVAKRLCELLGRDMPSDPQWDEMSRSLHDMLAQEVMNSMNEETLSFIEGQFDDLYQDDCAYPEMLDDDFFAGKNMPLVVSNREDGEALCSNLGKFGKQASVADVWEGPIPPGSYRRIDDHVNMSTAEFFFLRKANELPFAEAVWLGIELCGKFCTKLTKYTLENDYDFLIRPRTCKEELHDYLHSIAGTKEYRRAKRVLRHVLEQCCSPMSCYLYILLCLPRTRGSYGLEKPQLSAAYDFEGGFLPDSSGDYMAYDLCWADKHVALQYTGSERPSFKDLQALCAQDMQVICITDADICDPERFDGVARKLAELLSAPLLPATERWRVRHAKLLKQVDIPNYHHMRLLMDDIRSHRIV